MENIDHIFYINLEHRKDRKEHIEKEMERMDIKNYTRFNAISNEMGGIGCGLSHMMILKIAKEKGYKNILILEDDFIFIVSKETLNTNIDHLFKTLKDFDVCLLGFREVLSHEVIDDIIVKINGCATTSGYIINHHYYDKLLTLFEYCVTNLESTKNYSAFAIDARWMDLQKVDNWYRFKEKIGLQKADYSDIEKRFVDYQN